MNKMHETIPQQPISRFSVVDLAIDVLLITTVFAIPDRMPNFLGAAATGFFPTLLQVALLFVGYFGFALYVAHMYAATAIRVDSRWTHQVLFPPGPLVLFTCIFVVNVLFSVYSIFQLIDPPMLTSFVVIVEALAFGFTFGLEYAIERHHALNPKLTIAPSSGFSQSLTSIPYVLLTLLLLFPNEYFLSESPTSLLGRLVSTIAVGVIIYFLGHYLNKKVFGKLLISASMNPAMTVVVSVLMVVGFMGVDVLEVAARDRIAVDFSAAARIAYLFFFGIVPLRLGSILFSRTRLFNRVLGLLAVLFYVLVQSGLIDLGWKI
jgi:hypothetical protein